MRGALFLASFLLASPILAKGADQYLEIKDFHCGVDSYHSSLTIDECFVQDALNVYFDKTAGAVKRGGYTTSFSSKTYSWAGLWSYTDNSANIWMIARSSDTIMATTGIGTSLFNVKVATVSANDALNCVTALGSFYCVDPTQGVYYWNGSSTTFVAGSPHGSLIANFHGRVWVSGLAVPNGNFLYGSKYLDGTTWTTGINAVDPVALQVNLLDNADVITALLAGYNDVLYVFRNYNIYGLVGFDQSNFQISQLNAEVGCIDQRGIQPIFGGLVFPSARGIEFFDGYTATKISEPIKNLVDPITLNSSFSQNSWVQQTQADWNAGTFTPTSSLNSSIASPALVTSSGTFSDSSNSDFSSGITNNTRVSGTSVVISTNNSGNVTNNDFESGSGATASSWENSNRFNRITGAVNPGGFCSISGAQSGSYWEEMSDGSGTYTFEIITQPTTILDSKTLTQHGDCSWYQETLTPSTSNIGKRVRFRAHFSSSLSGDSYVTTSESYILGGAVSVYQVTSNTSGGVLNIGFDNVQNGSSTIATGSFTSRVFDTGISSVAASVAVSSTSNTEPISVDLQSSSASGGPFTQIASAPGVSGLGNRYLRYTSTFTIGAADDALSALNSATITWMANQAAFKSQIHNVGTITSWGNFSVVNALNGGAIAFSICSSTNSNMGVPRSCGSQTTNAQISISTGSYVQYYATFTVTAATHTPTLNSTTVNWYSGSRKPSMASMAYDNRYWLSVTTNTADTTNDATLILSKGPVWSVFSVKAGAFTIWKNQPYFADANATGYVYQLEQGLNDNGSAINAYIKTKDYSPMGLISDKVFDAIHMIADNAGAYNINTTYYVDRATTTFTLGTMVQNETLGTLINKLSIPIDSSHQNFGKTISFKFSNSDVDAPFRIYGGALNYHVRPPI